MITVTPYTFQAVTCGLVALWRNARAVSDWLTFTVSVICCSWCNEMSLTGSTFTDSSDKSDNKVCQLLPTPVVDAGKACGEPLHAQHVVIDFSPRPEDTDEVQERCIEFWKLIDSTHDLKEVFTTRIDDVIPEEMSTDSKRSEEKFITSESSEDFPAIDAVNQLQAKGTIKAAFETKIIDA